MRSLFQRSEDLQQRLLAYFTRLHDRGEIEVDPTVAANSLIGVLLANVVFLPLLTGDDPLDPDTLASEAARLFASGVGGASEAM